MSRTLFLVAEADAGSRADWPGPDRLRPITRDGWRQARDVAAQLRGQGIERVLASPWLRCRQTVQPLADELGLDVADERALAEGSEVEVAVSLLENLGDTAAVICTHEELARHLLARLGRPAPGPGIGPWLLSEA